MKKELRSWFTVSLFSLIIVAVYGALMRYKIGFEFPFLDQKFLLHAHSHFAFTGWITQTLMVLMVMSIGEYLPEKNIFKYRVIFTANILCAYGMLIAFTIQGYGHVAITFSTLSILIAYFYTWTFARDIRRYANSYPSRKWFLAALGFNVLSTFGTFALAYMMITKNLHQSWYLAAVYYYLHFQYNGWFFFACMGLLWDKLVLFIPGFSRNQSIFWIFALSCIPAYFLSTLWMKFPVWLFWLIVMAAAAQLMAWGNLVLIVRKHMAILKTKIDRFGQYLFLFVAITLSIKLLLQLFSTIPIISKLAFGFRPIVIAYLHLVLLAVISAFLLSWLFSFKFIRTNKMCMNALIVFMCGVFLNEFALMIQGIASFAYFPIPFINEILFAVSLLLLAGAVLMFLSQYHVHPGKEKFLENNLNSD